MSRIVAGHVGTLFPRDAVYTGLMEAGLEKSALDVKDLEPGTSILSWYKDIVNTYLTLSIVL